MINLRPVNETEFEATCRALVARWLTLESERNEWLEGQVYQLVGYLIEVDGLELYGPRRLKLGKRGPEAKPNAFALALRVIFVDDPDQQRPKARHLMGLRLAHAYHHFVPPPFLALFLNRASRLPLTTEDQSVRPGFEDWVAFHLRWFRGNENGDRGRYPSNIMRLSETIKQDHFAQFNLHEVLKRHTEEVLSEEQQDESDGDWTDGEDDWDD